jgi:hypothetical protein
MDRRALVVTVSTALGLLALAVGWWALSVPTDPATPPSTRAPTATGDAPEVPAVAAEASPEARPQQLGPLPGLAGRDGTDPAVRAEVLDHIEAMEAEKLGAEEAARRRAVREQMLDKRAEDALGHP